MIAIYHCTITEELTPQHWQKYISQLPSAQQDRNRRYRRWEDRHLHLFGRLLLLKGLLGFGYGGNILESIQANEYGKPFLSEDIDFSISHSGKNIVCAISKDARIGIDIEQKDRQFDLGLLGDVLSQFERDYVQAANDKCDAFFRIWTRKESLIKADGRGISAAPLDQIDCLAGEVTLANKKWFIRDIGPGRDFDLMYDIDPDNEYSASLSADIADAAVRIIPVQF